MSTYDSDVEFIFLGTGTSSSLPHVDCLTRPPGAKQCRTCLSTRTPEGKKNCRRNTSGVVRMKGKDGQSVTIVIDVGKTFQAASLEWFPKYGLRRIDAVLITHAHADAMNGLDDLRAWTLRSAIQPHVDLYVTQTTFKEVQRSFPYLVSKAFATGGGDVPDFKWHIIEDKVPFEIEGTGIHVTPFAVHHGRLFAQAPVPGFVPTPEQLPEVDGQHPQPHPSNAHPSHDHPPPTGDPKSAKGDIQPLLCFGFRIGDAVLYISDVSHIPDDVWPLLLAPPPAILALDCLHIAPHTSHFGLEQAVAAARRIGAARTYLLGFGHEVSHEEYVTIGEAAGGRRVEDVSGLSAAEREGVAIVQKEGEPIWMRPAFDGLQVRIRGREQVRDNGYD
ncbi:hypothetical protein PUNSTDRAFT_94447 [Punctularia strigosozonata HHB-11173 SS5]|uniref:uncharacterized protein n=1 Tax=Punctularia strigosozonata (strain HHB-11173) TaxID=741275 RepID=UPI0004417342|nr:uncharacterized protein PUNSTDRAFT_94447 [Punctularia strigosozonata HHB-11173 SS5]EIN13400.1 hypothetical protein PUNSTDRAFT_94447 [Punctularia strigosozonata HHB-11173 SS5]